ncbi:sugar transferase [Candidatus Gracilibacteria bacterium]|jgi:hypothetical protein|nr:sugar transferase [Candidatus Gracilibacteria bacterium]
MNCDGFLFRQERVGKNGVPVQILKIRTMSGEGSNIPTPDRLAGGFSENARVNLLGSVLRYLGIDEVPQLVNLVRGEIQIVGMRILPKSDLERLPEDIRTYYIEHTPSLIPGDLGIGSSNGDLETRYRYMREFMRIMHDVEREDGIGNIVKKNIFLLRLAVLACINKIKDPVHRKLIEAKFREMFI